MWDETVVDSVTIRPERDGDEAGIVESHIAAWLASVESDGVRIEHVDTADWILQRRMRLAEIADARTVVAELRGEIVGHLTWGGTADPDPDLRRIWSCYVHPDRWGTGTADRLMARALLDLDGNTVDLEVACENLRAQGFYERIGFRPATSDLRSDRPGLVRYLLDRRVSGLHAPRSDDTIGVCSRASTDL